MTALRITSKHALVVPLYGKLEATCLRRLKTWVEQGFWVVAVNNNPPSWSLKGIVASTVVNHHNRNGLAGGLNAGVAKAIEDGADFITLLDQDSVVSSESLVCLAKACGQELVVGPRIIDWDRLSEHTNVRSKIQILISSGTTFQPNVWGKVGPFIKWMEIDYIDHEWCSRARSIDIRLGIVKEARLFQTFGSRHPNALAHNLGLQLYSPYRRAIALRNLRWLLIQRYVPLNIRLKEMVKMLVKPWIWLILEQGRRGCLTVIWVGLTAPLKQPFPMGRLEKLK